MTANLQSYSVPFDPRVPPVYPASVINDEFRAQSPSLPPIGPGLTYVALDPKWSTFAPDGGFIAAFVDPQRQMMLLSGSPEKKWVGIMQDLPLPPVGLSEGIGFMLVTRMLPASIQESGNDDWGPYQSGLLLGEDMRGAPLTTQLWAGFTQFTRASDVIVGSTIAAHFVDWSFPVVADGEASGLPYQYLAAQVFSAQPTPGVFDTIINILASVDGVFYTRLFQYPDLTAPVRQFALAHRIASPTGVLTAADFVRYNPYSALVASDDVHPFSGEILQLGSV